MFRMWGRVFKNNHVMLNHVYENDQNDTRTHKVFNGLDEICHTFDLTRPIWLDKNVRDFQEYSLVRFDADSFVDTIDFDYLEIRMIEED